MSYLSVNCPHHPQPRDQRTEKLVRPDQAIWSGPWIPASALVNSPSYNDIQKRPTPPVFPNEQNQDEIDDKAVYEDLLLLSESNFIDMVEDTPPPPVPKDTLPKPIATPRGSIASRKSTRTSVASRPSKVSTASSGTLSRSIKQRAHQIEMDLNRMMSTEPKEISREQKGSF